MPFIQNCSLANIRAGMHKNPYHNSMLIQICDPAYEFPKPHHNFRESHQFEFLDIEPHDTQFDELKQFAITRNQATAIVSLLQKALQEDMNVIVHCHAGLCRSGAVAEVGVMMGFEDTGAVRTPNIMVKQFLMRELGWTYD